MIQKHHRFWNWLCVILSFVVVLATPITTFAWEPSNIPEGTLDFFNLNGIYNYNPGASSSCTITVGSYSGEAGNGLTATQAGFVDSYHDIAEALSIEYGIPWEAVMAQGIVESAAGTSRFAVERNNFFGIGAFDSNPNNAFYYDTPSDGWRGYYENIRKTATYRNHGVFQEPNITNPYSYIQAVKNAGYATDPEYVSKISNYIAKIESRAADKGWKTSAELAAAYPEMLTNAAALASGAGTAGSNVASGVQCVSTGGNGSINQTAIDLSWPERGHDPWTGAKETYKTALAATGVNRLGDSCSMNGNSCDAFVVTVLRYSGVDPNAPCCGAANVRNYLAAHPELYEEIPNIGNSSNMQPGDIRASSSHVEIYVQLSDGTYAIASASHCDRTADHAGRYYPDSSYRIFRKR